MFLKGNDAKNKETEMQYKHSQIESDFASTNLERFFELCRISMGSNYYQWHKHEKLHDVLSYAHRFIYLRTDEYKKNNGLLLYIRFLQQVDKSSEETKKTRGSYNAVLLAALSIGLINLSFCKNYIVDNP